MKCSACKNPAFDDHPKAPLCRSCLEGWRDLEDSPRITQPREALEFSAEARHLRVDVAFREWIQELRRRDPVVARKVQLALPMGDAGVEWLGESLTAGEVLTGLNALLAAIARTWGASGLRA